MDELQSQVTKVRRRLNLGTTVDVFAVVLSIMIFVALIGLAIPKLLPITIDYETWCWAWCLGCVGVGVLLALVIVSRKSASAIDAAIEIDRRFGLKERVSSTMAMSSAEQETDAGRALLADASYRLSRIDIREHFAVKARPWNFLLPLVPTCLAFLLVALVPNAKRTADASTETSTVEVKQQIERSTEELRKKLAERRKLAEAQGLAEAREVFAELERAASAMQDKPVDRSKSLAKLNSMAAAVKQRRAEMGDRESLKKQLAQLKNLSNGPADEVVKAMKAGDFAKALKAVEKLQAKMSASELDQDQMKQLAKQLQQLSDKLSQMAQAQQAAKAELEQQIRQAQQAGDLAKAGELQDKLNKMNALGPQMNQLGKLADQLAKASQAAAQGDAKQAMGQMAAASESLSELEAAASQMDMLNDALDELAATKNALNCENCGGSGCQMCQGNMLGQSGLMGGMGQQSGVGMGEGQGEGDRPESETGSRFYDSRVPGEIRRGRAVVTGTAGGPNRSGETLEEIKAAIESGGSDGNDPLTGARVPRGHRDHAQQYFDALRDGQ